ncbi:MAG: Site-specific DNA-methyltransferase (Adenine-specific) [candidate division TA06 bacterium 34_109]|uniref:site-specific DNA-methyltransferase (adenine-specific) n=1 Tax=candidate division TA06 bacterium 34_109 TaxID=1635277 RepID=A0A101I0E3_UNCT6|nr:MAG: Site-specific DNA-methyltransferase (Adenine-specific) [candidate division TA06 bacterium 34_109]
MANNHNEIEKRLWNVADKLRANTALRPNEFYIPVLGLIFLRYSDYKFQLAELELKKKITQGLGRISIKKEDYQALNMLYIPEQARYSAILNLPEGSNIGKTINEAMRMIESQNDNLKGVLPKSYDRLNDDTLIAVLKLFSEIPMDIDGDIFGKIYEYFLGNFAMSEGQRGGEFFTPTSIVKLITEIIEPYHGRVYDPACGSAGMFVQSAKFVERHHKKPIDEIAIFGQEKVASTIQLCKMNLVVRGLEGDIRQGNTFYEDTHHSLYRFDYVMSNPPFNVSGVNKEKLKNDPRFSYGIPRADNANYLWIQIFLNSLNEKGRAGFVMANSAADAGYSELEIRKKIIEDKVVDIIIAVGPNFFYTVSLPCTLWFFDRGKKNTKRENQVLFIDARDIYTPVDRAHNEFSPEQKSLSQTLSDYIVERILR